MNDWVKYHAETESTLKAMRDCLKDREQIIEQLIADNVELMEANKYLSNKLSEIVRGTR
jgi:Trp operon repressor